MVTGASSGMGRDFVFAVDREYDLDEIWVIARRKERLEQLSGQCRARIRPMPLDLLDRSSFDVLSDRLAAERPDVIVLVNAAGYGLFGTFEQMGVAEQTGIVDLNCVAMTAVTRICLPYMSSGASVINLGSNSSWQPVPYLNVYAASKAYVLSFSRGLGRELKDRGIHVMCVCPGWVKTEFNDTAVRDDTISYYDRWYESEQVVSKAMRDLKKRKKVSILGFPVRSQVRLVKLLPASWIMDIWCRQQKK